jgi:hypothetical protein
MTSELTLRVADVALAGAHLALTGFNLLGWIWPRTRRLHRVVLGGTLLSWFGLGVFYGWGYCPLTDWHWQVKLALGERGLPGSFVKYWLDRVTGVSWDPLLVDVLALVLAVAALAASVALNLRDRRQRDQGLSS